MTTPVGRVAPKLESLLDADVLAAAGDGALADTAAAILAEQHRRALAANDLEALVDEAFETGFVGSKGDPVHPWLVGTLLVCPGTRRNRSATSHDCAYVSVDGGWVWDSEEVIVDVVRHVPGPKLTQRSITIVGAVEGMKLDVVASASRSGGPCEMKTATSYQISRGALEKVATRARKPNGHR